MKKILEEEIYIELEKKYNILIQKYGTDKTLGIFLIGAGAWGFAESIKDLKFIAIYLPTFEELCTANPLREEMDNIEIKDIRLMYDINTDIVENSLELLASKYSIINPIYESIYHDCLDSEKELIAHYHEAGRILSAWKRLIKAYESKDYFEVARLWISALLYSEGNNIEDCFCPKRDNDIEYLWKMKWSLGDINLHQIKSDFKKMMDKASKTKNTSSLAQIKKGIIELLTAALNHKVQTENFLIELTKNEQMALNFILMQLNDNGIGNISISKITEETKISRPVYKNLLIKLKDKGAARVISQGAKGTYIQILDSNLLLTK